MKRIKYLIGVIIWTITLSFSQSAFASDVVSPHLSLSPAVAQIETDQGETERQIIKIRNQSDVALPINVKVTDFTAEDETGVTILGDTSDDVLSSPRLWFDVVEPSFILDPGETKQVHVTISVPSEIPLGGYYASVLFEPQLPTQYYEQEQVRTIPVIGTLFLVAVGIDRADRSDAPLIISELSIPEEFHLLTLEKGIKGVFGLFKEVQADQESAFSVIAEKQFPFTLRIKNNDLFHVKPSGTLSILEKNGTVMSTVEITPSTILPQKTRIFPVAYETSASPLIQRIFPEFMESYIAKLLFTGKHQAHLVLTADDHVIEETTSFWFFPWKTLLVTILFVSVIIFVFYKLRFGQRFFHAIGEFFNRAPKDVKNATLNTNNDLTASLPTESQEQKTNDIFPTDGRSKSMRIVSPKGRQSKKKEKKKIMKF